MRIIFAALLLLLAGCTQTDQLDLPEEGYLAIVPWAPGGGTDKVAQPVVESLSKTLGEPITIKYMEGDGGAQGSAWALKRKTHNDKPILLFNALKSIEAYRRSNKSRVGLDKLRPYVAWKTPAPIIAVSTRSDIDSMELLLEAMGGFGVSIATAGEFSAGDIGAKTLSRLAGAQYQTVRKNSGVQAGRAAVSGEAEMVVQLFSELRGMFDDGELRPLAIISDKQYAWGSRVIPPLSKYVRGEVPELGVSFGMVIPSDTDAREIDRLDKAWLKLDIYTEALQSGAILRETYGNSAMQEIEKEVEADRWASGIE